MINRNFSCIISLIDSFRKSLGIVGELPFKLKVLQVTLLVLLLFMVIKILRLRCVILCAYISLLI